MTPRTPSRLKHPSAGRCRPDSWWGLLALVLACAGAAPAWGQALWRGADQPGAALRPARLERDASAENLLKKAEDALRRQDWKLAIDSLQRILDGKDAGVLLREPDSAADARFPVYESPQARATVLLAAMPPEGIAAYRVLFDGKARMLLARAIEEGDPADLAALVSRYALTSYGDDAAELLAGWRLDIGDAAGALALLDRIVELHPDPDVPKERMAFKRAVCWLMLGDADRARAVLESLDEADGDGEALARMRKLVEEGWQHGAEEARVGTESWPMAFGDAARQGRMPAVMPELRGNLPWRFPLLPDYPDWWENHWQEDRNDKERETLAASAVVSDGRIFVRSLRQLVALDLESLDALWEAEPPLEAATLVLAQRQGGFRPRVETVQSRYSDRERLLYDQVGASLAVIDGKVFAIERESADGPRQVIDFGRRAYITSFASGTRLVARDAATGKTVWRQGRTGTANDPLDEVDFLSVPLAVGGELWVVYARDGDLMLAALAPEDGALRRTLALCTVDLPQIEGILHDAIQPACDGSSVYITAGVGTVLAVDIERFGLRWATQYPRVAPASGSLAPTSWSGNAAVLAGTVVVAAPVDAEMLLALDRGDGSVRWVRQRPEGAYDVLGADDRRIWLGGSRPCCLALDDGREVWRLRDGERLSVTGRGALSGGRILVPTRTELAAFDAATGARLESQPLPDDQLPLGNLLCTASALLSVDANEIRKFPDLTQAYPRTLARHERDPADVHTATRLAWMELLRGAPERAFAVLEQIDAAGLRGAAQIGDVSRLRVDALLGMAAGPDVALDAALGYLEEAVRLTSADRDRLRATMALAGKLREAGRGDDAYLALWELGLTSAGDGYVTVEPKLRNKARRVIAEVLARFARDLTARQLARIAERSQAVFAEALAQMDDPDGRLAALERLRQLGELDDAGGGGQRALLELARAERAAGRFERSAQYFLEAIRRDQVARLTAEALLDLADQYLAPPQELHAEAARLLDRVEREFAEVLLERPDDPQPRVAGLEAERQRGRLDPRRLAEGVFAEKPRHFQLRDAEVGEITDTRLALFDFDPASGEAGARNVLLYSGRDEVLALRSADGAVAWTAALHLLGRGTDDLLAPTGAAAAGVYPRAFCDGQTAVINGSEGIFAVGLLSGRRLWGVAYEEPDTAAALDLRNRLVAVDNGRLVYAPRRGVLACASVRDGGDVVWERVLSGDKIDTVFLKDDYCITIDNARQVATTYAAGTGRLLSRIAFTQPEGEDAPIAAAYVSGHVVVPDGARAVACYSVSTGERNWRRETGDEVRWIFKPGEGFAGVCCRGGGVLLLDVLGGDVKLDAAVPQAAEGYAEGVLHEDALLLLAITATPGGDEPALVSIDVATGTARWSRDGFGVTGANRYAQWKLLRLAGDVLPMFRLEKIDVPGAARPRDEIAVEILDKQTGAVLGPIVRTGQIVTRDQALTGEIGIWPGRMLVETRRGVLALPITDELNAQVRAQTRKGRLP